MDAYQPTFWDNIALENGYGLLSGLQVKATITQFKDAMQSPMADLESIQGVITCCEFWQDWLGMLSGGPEMDDPGDRVERTFQEILEDFMAYPFDPRMTGFKKNLLGRLTDHFLDKCPLDLKTFETLFDLLLGLNRYPRAVDLASHAWTKVPKSSFNNIFWPRRNGSTKASPRPSATMPWPSCIFRMGPCNKGSCTGN